MKRLIFPVLLVSAFSIVGCGGGESSSIVVDRDEARELYDSDEYRAMEAAAEERSKNEPNEDAP